MVEENNTQLNDQVLTIREVAQYLRLSEAKIYELARNGTIPAVRSGKSWRFQKELLMEWVRNGGEANEIMKE